MGGVSVSHRTASHPLNHIHPTLCTPACLSLCESIFLQRVIAMCNVDMIHLGCAVPPSACSLICLSVRREREREEESENASERSHASTPHTNHTQSHSLTATTDHTSLTAQRLTHSGESRGAPLLRHIWCRGGVLF